MHRGNRSSLPLILNHGTRSRWVVNITPRSLYSLMGKLPPTQWVPEPVWTIWRREKSPSRIQTQDRPARNTDYAKKPGAEDIYQQLRHFSHTVYSCSYNDSHINPLNPELNPICYLLALLGAHNFLHVSRIRVKLLTYGRLMSYIYGVPILDVSRSHTTTQHSR